MRCNTSASALTWRICRVIGVRAVNVDLVCRSIAAQYYIAKEKDCALVDVKFDAEYGEEFHKRIGPSIEKFGMHVFEADLWQKSFLST